MRWMILTLALTLLGVGEAAAQAGLEGRWLGACAARDGGGKRNAAEVAGDKVVFRIGQFSDAGCARAAFDFIWNASFKVGQARAGAKDIDFILLSIDVVPRVEAVAAEFNRTSFCGLRGWVAGMPKDVTGLTCGGNRLGTAGYKAYNVFRLAGDRLYLTFERSAPSETQRPAAAGDAFYLRQ